MAKSPLERLRVRARQLGSRAVDGLLSNEERADAVGAAVRRVQEARSMLDERGVRMLGAMGLATQADLDRVKRKVGRLRKRMVRILDGLDEG